MDEAIRDTTVTKISSEFSPRGRMGQAYLASGKRVSMRLWQESPYPDQVTRTRSYETVGYVLQGRAELHIEGQMVLLEPGDSWVVPEGTRHRYVILETFVAVEATAPPAQAHARDED